MILFETDKKPLTFLLDKIDNKELGLPDFQRSFVWDPEATRLLVASILSSFPAGNLLLMQGGAKVFAPRSFEEAPDLVQDPTYLVLDGQQRLTSLYQAFTGVGSHRFFLNVQELLDGADLDEALEVYAAKRANRWGTLAQQAEALMMPLDRARTFAYWREEVLDYLEETNIEDVKKLRLRITEIESTYVKPVELYQFPVTTLSADTPVEAVCTIFETLNKTGVKLSVFELLTARAFAHDVRLRDKWDVALVEHPILQEFAVDPYYVLQAIAVNVARSAKRSAVLKLDVPDIIAHWDSVVAGMAEALQMLRNECGVLVGKLLPYNTMLVTMGAVWGSVTAAKGPDEGARRAKLRRWFWCSVFSQAYENAPNTRAETDALALKDWLGGGTEPDFVAGFSFDPGMWRDVTGRQRALYRATIALNVSAGPLDFYKGHRLTPAIVLGEEADDHHVFPQKYLSDSGRGELPDTVLNHTLIDKITNIRIGGKAPSMYLAEMIDGKNGFEGLGADLVAAILRSHELPEDFSGPLFEDRYDEFLTWRAERLADRLREVTG